MFKISSAGWQKLDKEIDRIKDGGSINLVLSLEVVPTQDGINLQEELKKVSSSVYDLCEFEYEVHEDHGAMACQKEVIDSLSDIIKDAVNAVNSSGSLFVANFQAEVYRDQDVVSLIFGDSYNATAILPHESGKKLVILQLEFTI